MLFHFFHYFSRLYMMRGIWWEEVGRWVSYMIIYWYKLEQVDSSFFLRVLSSLMVFSVNLQAPESIWPVLYPACIHRAFPSEIKWSYAFLRQSWLFDSSNVVPAGKSELSATLTPCGTPHALRSVFSSRRFAFSRLSSVIWVLSDSTSVLSVCRVQAERRVIEMMRVMSFIIVNLE